MLGEKSNYWRMSTKGRKVNAEMQIEIEKQRAATETNRMMVQAEMIECREAEYIAAKEREKQELLKWKEEEKLEIQACYEQQLVLERKLAEEKEKCLRSENQTTLLLERRELLPPVMNLMTSRPNASSVAMTSVPTFAKPAPPHKSILRNAVPTSVIGTKTVTGPRPATITSGNTSVPIPAGRQTLPQTTMPTSVPQGKQAYLHVAVPRLSCALASATTPLMTTSTQILQPEVVANETRMATVNVVTTSNDTVVIMPCAVDTVCTADMLDGNHNTSLPTAPCAEAMQPENMPQAPVQPGSTGTTPNFGHKLVDTQVTPMPPVESKPEVTAGHNPLVILPVTQPTRSPEQPQVVPQQSIPTVIVRPPTAPKTYSGATSYKAYKEYFERLSICNGWASPLIKAQNLLINLDGAAAEATRGLEVTSDSDYDKIWELLKRRFALQDDVEHSRRLFDKRRQEDNESVAKFELGLRLLYREAWPTADIESADADSALQRQFVNGLRDQGCHVTAI